MYKKKTSMKAATSALIMGLALASSGVGATILATPAVAIEAPASLPNGSKDVTFTIFKRLLGPEEIRGTATGDKEKNPAGEPLQGVKFSVKRLNYDVTTAEGLKKARAASIEDAKANLAGDDEQLNESEYTTDADGKIYLSKTDGLKVGAYLVEETDASNATVGRDKKSGIVKSNPFIVFLPMTDTNGKTAEGEDIASGARTTWQYNVVAYPKNTDTKVGKVLKDADDEDVRQNQVETTNLNGNVGDKISYVLDYTVPALVKDKQRLSYWQMYDRIPDHVKVGAGVKPSQEELDGAITDVQLGDEKLKLNVDYIVTYDAKATETNVPADTTGGPRREIRILLTNYGLAKLSNAATGTKLKATFNFTIDPKATGTFEAINDGGVKQGVVPEPTPDIPENPPEPTPPTPDNPTPNVPTPPDNPDNPITPKVDSYWVKLKIQKYNAEAKDRENLKSEEKLAGAEFNLYRCSKKEDDNTYILSSQLYVTKSGDGVYSTTPTKPTDKQLKDDATRNDVTITTGADGTATVNSLRFRKALAEKASEGYCLVETKSPEGYQLMTDPIFFKITDANKKADMEVDAPNVPNHDDDRPHLPATGGMGVGLLLLLGASVIGAGAWFARRNNKARA